MECVTTFSAFSGQIEKQRKRPYVKILYTPNISQDSSPTQYRFEIFFKKEKKRRKKKPL